MKYLAVFILLFTTLSFSTLSAEELKSSNTVSKNKPHLFVISGVIVNSSNSKKIDDFVQMIARKSGYPLKPYFVDSYARLSQILRDKPDSLAWTCGAPFVEDNIKDQQQLIAVPLLNKLPTYSSYVVTKKSAKGTKLIDFKGKILAYSDLRSNSGFVAPSIVLKNNGADIEDFFRVKINAGTHEKSIDAIYRGIADVGAIDEYIWDNYTKDKPEILDRLHIIEKIGPFPFTPIVAGSQVNEETINNIKKALINMTANELKHFNEQFQMDGFVEKEDSFYQPIKEMMLKLGYQL
ncbi:phosphate/phosphite/phosphonate ABC transporter substrate-binding protein [sulfur-oxidizing endosymbiont of Gigantopelta aegis]|uniref:phosphate/phosphite/phosphonate ABC transporter substrate-binding protein n=1 Tax=sulfur-oxidizing endosymbiont of Gigantopelta aegis TaxID=2794934 RepID=UPI0018DBEAFF|nr:PhnD/SsuA/transferrin family substrate-binding protein [sulfur-oxidizing endosymbiont of Gigantopelta aegis]